MSSEQAIPETKGVSVQFLGSVDLAPVIEGMTGRQLRMRCVTIEPGGVFGPVHDHVDRPGIVDILEGTITDHRNGIATDYGPGLGWPEDSATLHLRPQRVLNPLNRLLNQSHFCLDASMKDSSDHIVIIALVSCF